MKADSKKSITRIFDAELFPPFKLISIVDYPLGSHGGEPHTHDFFQTLLVISGKFSISGKTGKEEIIGASELLVIPKGVPHTWDSKTRCKLLQICSAPMLGEDFGEMALLFGTRPSDDWVKLRLESRDLKRICSVLGDELDATLPGSSTIIHSSVMELLARAFRLFSAGMQLSSPGKKNEGKAEDMFGRSLDYIRSNYRRKITLEELAANSFLGLSRFSELFRRHAGCSPMHYVIGFRMKKARALLSYSDMSVSEVAEYLGFDSVHYFSNAFKKFYGHEPSRLFRRR
ncbi:MAG: hypothetical protein A2X49_05865 [Lentisphaerae bacterium GWF2_52_8]|nr:MAG: hypothetical protein A2X49_05865 [Lentisphaerae bacterium GWF2_52_8]